MSKGKAQVKEGFTVYMAMEDKTPLMGKKSYYFRRNRKEIEKKP